jgi:hypothetical protein
MDTQQIIELRKITLRRDRRVREAEERAGCTNAAYLDSLDAHIEDLERWLLKQLRKGPQGGEKS